MAATTDKNAQSIIVGTGTDRIAVHLKQAPTVGDR